MPDTSIARNSLGGTTLNRKWFVDIDSTPTSAATWVGLFGVTDLKPVKSATAQDTSDTSSQWKGTQNTALGWGIEGKLKRAVTTASALAYDPGQELLRAASDLTGVAARVHVRIYEMEAGGPRVEAYDGWGTVEWTEEGGNMEAISTVSFKINGDGPRNVITHPQPALPYILSILPLGRAVGGQVVITGTNLTGATAITFGGTNAPTFSVVSDTKVAVDIPAGTGAKSVVITTPQGASAGFSYTVA